MGLLDRLRGTEGGATRRRGGALTKAIHERLAHLEPARAEFVAAFAGLLARVAHADSHVSPAERDALARLVAEHARLTADEAETVAAITCDATALADVDYAALTRAFNEIATREQKAQLVDCLYALAAEDLVSVTEDEEIRAVGRALMMSHDEVIAIRRRYKEQLEVIHAARRLRKRP